MKVNDRGPFYHSRDIDLSYGAAKRIGLTDKGVEELKLRLYALLKSQEKA